MSQDVRAIAQRTKRASRAVANLPAERRSDVIVTMARLLEAEAARI